MYSAVVAALSLLFLSSIRKANMAHAHTLPQTPYTRPIIGIVALDTHSENAKHGKTYIPASYVSFLQQAGARVVPIRGGESREYYDQMVDFTNGMLFPGGQVIIKESMYGRSTKLIFERALKINREGDHYPIWGTCLGFQTMCYWAVGVNYLKETDSRNVSWPLNFTEEASSSRLFGELPSNIKEYLCKEPTTQNQHRYSILVDDFKTTKLHSFFNALSTNTDRNGVEFISTMEAKDYPFYGSQWHPEKNNFNWNPKYVINHGDHAVRVSQYIANFFVREARKSGHRFPDVKTEADSLIQNYKQIYFADGTFYDNYYIDV